MPLTGEDRHYVKTAIGALEKLLGDPRPMPGPPVAATGKAQEAGKTSADARPVPGGSPGSAPAFEELYQRIKARLLDELRVDPTFVKLLANQPEILLEIEPVVVEMDGGTLQGRICRLVAEGFLDTPRSQADINRELARTGAQAHTGRLSEAVNALKLIRIVTQEDTGYRRAPGVKVSSHTLQTQ
jgi:hypothetical protein